MSYLRNLASALVGNVSQKASAVGPMIARAMLGQPVWPKRNFEALAKEGYQQNPVVARSIQLIADGVASITMELHQGRGRQTKTIDEHPLLDLLAAPNPEQDYHDLITSVVSHYMITGNTYLERTDEDDIETMELYALRPDRVRIVPGEYGTPAAYEYAVNGMTRRFQVEVDRDIRPVLHLKRFNPLDDWYGMSALDPASWAIDTHSGAARWNKALLDNAGAPSGAFVFAGNVDNGGTMSDEQHARLKEQLTESVQGARNAGRPLLLEGGLDWKSIGIDPERMQFVEGKNLSAREIAFSLGVPPMLLGIPGDNTYSNYAEANRAFYRQTVIPLAMKIARALTAWMEPHLERGMRLVPDLDTIEALNSERRELWDKLEKSQIITLNEKREALRYEAYKPGKTGADLLYMGAGLLPIDLQDDATGGPEADLDDPLLIAPPKKPEKGKPEKAEPRRLN
jgi:HK97 family phage portal protein